jgi:hypothetical protein
MIKLLISLLMMKGKYNREMKIIVVIEVIGEEEAI